MKTTDEIMALADQWMFMRLHPSQTWSDVEIARNRLKAAIEELAKPVQTSLTVSIQAAHEMGVKGANPTDRERLLFEAWMKGHCWDFGCEWDGSMYRNYPDSNDWNAHHAMRTRELWVVWRDCAALHSQVPMETPLTDQRIIEIAKATDTAEPGRDGYILPVSFARAIESEIKGLNRVKQGVSGTVRIVTDWSAA